MVVSGTGREDGTNGRPGTGKRHVRDMPGHRTAGSARVIIGECKVDSGSAMVAVAKVAMRAIGMSATTGGMGAKAFSGRLVHHPD